MRTRYRTNAWIYLLILLSTLSMVAGAAATDLSLATTMAPATTTPTTANVAEQSSESQVSDLETGDASQITINLLTPIEDETQGTDIKVHFWNPDARSRVIVHSWDPNVPSKLSPDRIIVHSWDPNVPSKLSPDRILVHSWKPDTPSRIIVHR